MQGQVSQMNSGQSRQRLEVSYRLGSADLQTEAYLATRHLSVSDPMSKPGRKPTERGAYNPHPARQLGRVSDEDWTALKEAAERAGVTFTEWAVPALLKKARRESRKDR